MKNKLLRNSIQALIIFNFFHSPVNVFANPITSYKSDKVLPESDASTDTSTTIGKVEYMQSSDFSKPAGRSTGKFNPLSIEKINTVNYAFDSVFNEKVRIRKNAIKIAPTSILWGYLGLSYERVLHPRLNYQGSLSIIGAGFKQTISTATGVGLRNSLRFFKKTKSNQNEAGNSALSGRYLELGATISRYKKTWTEDMYEFEWFEIDPYDEGAIITQQVGYFTFTNVILDINLGWQKILPSGILIDMYFGIGYGSQIISKQPSYFPDQNELEDYFVFTHIWGGKAYPATFTTGLRLGGIF